MPYKYGRRPPKNAPALTFGSFLSSAAPAHPRGEDYLARLTGWQLLGNDVAGDCNAVTWANMRRLVTATLTTEYYPTQAQVWQFYRTQNPGFDPNGSSSTNGPGSSQDWEQEKRSYRLAIRPLMSLGGDRLVLIPRRLEATQGVFAGYLLDGRVPWPPADLPQKVRDAFTDFRKSQNRQLERAVGAVLSQLHLPAKTNIEQHHAERAGLHLEGEIDALAADPDRSRLWVCEVKDPTAAFSPSTTASRVSRFLKPGGHVNKLLRNVRDIEASPAGWARFIDAPDPDRDWRIQPVMITRHVEPAAFTSNPAVPFVVVDDLATLIHANSDPANGPVWPNIGSPAQD